MRRLRDLSDRAVWWLSLASWILAVAVFVAGIWIGLNWEPGLGAGMWLVAAVLGFLPFTSARTRHTGWWA